MATIADDLVRHHLFTVDEYRRMGESNIFYEDDRVELIEGEIVEMPPIGSHHSGATIRIHKRLEQAVHAVFNTVGYRLSDNGNGGCRPPDCAAGLQ